MFENFSESSSDINVLVINYKERIYTLESLVNQLPINYNKRELFSWLQTLAYQAYNQQRLLNQKKSELLERIIDFNLVRFEGL